MFASNPALFAERMEAYSSTLRDCEKAAAPEFHYYLGLARMLVDDHRDAEQAFNEALALEPPSGMEYRALSSLTNLYFIEGEYGKAFTLGIRLGDVKYAAIESDDLARGKIVIANALIDAGLYLQADQTLNSVDVGALRPRMACVAHLVRIQLVYKRGQGGAPTDDVMSSIKQCREQGQNLYALLSLYWVSQMLADAGEPESARDILEADSESVSRLGYRSLQALWLAAQSQTALMLGDVEASIEAGQQALLMEDASSALDVELTVHDALAKAYEMAGDPARSLRHTRSFHQAYSRAHDRQLSSATAYHAAQMQEAQRVQEIELLNQQKALLELENALARAETENARLNLLIAIGVVLIVSVLAYRAIASQRKLKDQVRYDNLTRLFSRDHFMRHLVATVERAETRGEDLGYVLFDLDRFKRINDSFGHPTGDWVLGKVAEAARTSLRKSDAIGRIGGEEFAILLPECGIDRAQDIAEEVRARIAAIDTRRSGHEFRVSASFGVTSAFRSGYVIRRIIADADKALYRSKKEGRDRVSVHPETQDSEASGDLSVSQPG